MNHIDRYLDEARQVLEKLDRKALARLVEALAALRAGGGRLFVLGVGGGAGNAAHAVNDFRKICGLEAYAPTDNVAELTARVNDDGWEGVFSEWLKVSRLGPKDAVFVFSVGGGSREKNVSLNIVKALELAKTVGAKILGVVGRDGGCTAKLADACVVVPVVSPESVTAHTEAFQAVVWHLLVSHPDLQKNPMKWESVKGTR
ncbi:MAG: SIS domain-containing protein [Elusimicrobiota bacterium]|jgi:D-sedoheptulose 7-phosphate isomerase